MSEKFRRRVRVEIGEAGSGIAFGHSLGRTPIGIDEPIALRISAKIEKDRKAEPNKAEVQIYNLSASSRNSIQKNRLLTVQAGYDGSMGQVFQGDIRNVSHVRSGADWITKITAGDGSKAYRTARCTESFAPGTKAADVLRKLAQDYGLKIGNFEEALKGKAAITEYLNGKTLVGQVHDQLERILADVGLEYSIQDGALQIVEIGKAVDAPAVFLSPSSGLIGSPEFGETSDDNNGNSEKKKTVLKIKSLLQHDLVPGRLVDLQSQTRDGLCRADKVTHTFDTFSLAYYSEVEASLVDRNEYKNADALNPVFANIA